MDLSLLAQLHPLAKAAILGVVEGATEFIPVSSTGHLIVAGGWLGFTGEEAKAFEIFIQLGAILAIVWLYRADLARAVAKHKRGVLHHQVLVNLFVGFLPAAAIGFLTHEFIKEYLFNPVTVAVALVLGGIAILLIERWRPEPRIGKLSDMSVFVALGVGIAQVLSLVPGVSRSGATIMGAYSLGLTRKAAAEFSFFLAIGLRCGVLRCVSLGRRSGSRVHRVRCALQFRGLRLVPDRVRRAPSGLVRAPPWMTGPDAYGPPFRAAPVYPG